MMMMMMMMIMTVSTMSMILVDAAGEEGKTTARRVIEDVSDSNAQENSGSLNVLQ